MLPARMTAAIWFIVPFMMTGCGSDSGPPTQWSSRSDIEPHVGQVAYETGREKVSASRLMREVFRRYRGANRYSDQAVLVATGPDETVVAPLAIHRMGDEIRIRAYECEVSIHATELIAVADVETPERFDRQVLVLRRGSQPIDQWLTSDAILAEALSRGAGGPPPQLDWMFADKPMEGLFEPNNRFSYVATETIEDRVCEVVEVQNGNETFRFFVDAGGGLIRRVELPSVPTADANGEVHLAVELRQATFDFRKVQVAINDTEIALPKNPRWVRRLLVPPPRLDRRIGRQLEAPRSDFQDSNFGWFIAGGDDELFDYFEHLRGQGITVATQNNRPIPSWPIRRINQRETSDLLLATADGKIHFVQPLTPPILPEALMAATVDVADGKDVAREMLRGHLDAAKRYQTQLARVTVQNQR